MFLNRYFWQALASIGIVAAVFARAVTLYPGKPIRTLIILEDPGNPLDIGTAQAALAQYHAVVVPGFTVTP